MKLRVASFNLNGIRAATKRGFADWLTAAAPDVLCLQEVRATDAVLRDHLGDSWFIAHHEPTIPGHKGRAGVAIAVRAELAKNQQIEPRLSLPDDQFDNHGRWVEVDLDVDGTKVTIVSVYVHSGEVDTDKQVAKYAFLETMTKHLHDLRSDHDARVLVCGDINIGHREDDIKNWKGNLKRAGFLPEERAYLDTWVNDQGWVDVVRDLHGPGPGPYSWWSWRGKAFDNDSGWRIDYHFASPTLAAEAADWKIWREDSYDTRVSDHAAVTVDYTIG